MSCRWVGSQAGLLNYSRPLTVLHYCARSLAGLSGREGSPVVSPSCITQRLCSVSGVTGWASCLGEATGCAQQQVKVIGWVLLQCNIISWAMRLPSIAVQASWLCRARGYI